MNLRKLTLKSIAITTLKLAVAMTILVLVIGDCALAQSVAQPKQADKQSGQVEEPDKEVVAAFEAIASAIKQDQLESAMKLMTPAAADDYVADKLVMSIQMANENMAMGGGFAKKLNAVNVKYGLDKVEIPQSFFMGPQVDEETFKKVKQQVLAKVKNENRTEAVKQIDAALSEVMHGMNPFDGKVTSQFGAGAKVTLKIESEMPGLPAGAVVEQIDANDLQYKDNRPDIQIIEMDGPEGLGGAEMGGGEMMFMTPPMFLTFEKTKESWLWSGRDEAREKKAFEEFEEQMGGMIALPIIENIELTGTSVKGNEVDLKDYKGKFVLVDFWGTWCGPCVAELPNIKKIYAALKEHGFEVLGVAADDVDTLQEFLEDKPLPWTNIVDANGKIADQFGVQAFPTTLLIDDKGEHVKSELHGVELLDELVKRMKLDKADFAELRKELMKGSHYSGGLDQDDADDDAKTGKNASNKVGFKPADADSDGSVSQAEMKVYLDERLEDADLPHEKIFTRMDADKNDLVSESEFAKRHEAIEHFMGNEFFGMGMSPPVDPGESFVPFEGLAHQIDDAAIFGALFHRYQKKVDENGADWPAIELGDVPETIESNSGVVKSLTAKVGSNATSTLGLVKSSVIIAGGGQELNFQLKLFDFIKHAQELLAKRRHAIFDSRWNFRKRYFFEDSKLYVATQAIVEDLGGKTFDATNHLAWPINSGLKQLVDSQRPLATVNRLDKASRFLRRRFSGKLFLLFFHKTYQ